MYKTYDNKDCDGENDDNNGYDEMSTGYLQGPATASTTLHLVEQSLLVAR